MKSVVVRSNARSKEMDLPSPLEQRLFQMGDLASPSP